MLSKFDEFKVYQRSYKISLEIHKDTLKFPSIERYSMVSQMQRASKSICSNFAEGFAKQSLSKLEFRKYLSICIGSCNEMIVWVNYSKDLEYINSDVCGKYIQEYTEIAKMLQSLYKTISKPNT
jgi:four helix bundle protein